LAITGKKNLVKKLGTQKKPGIGDNSKKSATGGFLKTCRGNPLKTWLGENKILKNV